MDAMAMDAMVPNNVVPETIAVLETLPLSVVLLRDDGSTYYANAPARNLATVIHDDPNLGLAKLVANPPWLSSNPDPPSEGCEDCLNCYGMDGLPLCVVRQWRTCGDTSLLSVTIRPARTSSPSDIGLHPTSTAGADALSSEQHRMLQADKLATVGQLAAGMAHEINNPICYVQSNMGAFRDYLNKLFGLLELSDDLLRDTRMSAEERAHAMEARKQAVDFAMIVEDLPALLEESREGVDRIRKIVQNLRDFSRSDTTEAFQLFDVHRALTTALDLVRSLSGKHLSFATHFESLPLIECNPTELSQVFMNILVNATQAVGTGGRIEITTRKPDGNCVQVDISDNGCGMDEHVLGHIFEPFFTTKGVGSGTGLGLSITFGIVKKHGGDIAVRSSVAKGSLFQITLPVKQPLAPTVSPA
jgi:signal transduction histidine kinase